jgi:hypothetical protein
VDQTFEVRTVGTNHNQVSASVSYYLNCGVASFQRETIMQIFISVMQKWQQNKVLNVNIYLLSIGNSSLVQYISFVKCTNYDLKKGNTKQNVRLWGSAGLTLAGLMSLQY